MTLLALPSALILSALMAAVPPSGDAPCAPSFTGASPAARGSATVDGDLRALYESGRSYDDFLSAATRRAELWHDNTDRSADLDPSLVARARAVGGRWHFLVVAVDSCSDSVSTIPFLAGLVAAVEGLEMRVVDPDAGRSVMESHRTSDGRAATPTVLLLDADFDEAGCFIERPPELQTWILENSDWSGQQTYEKKMAWYDEDGGHGTVEAFVEMLEAAERGGAVCR